MTEPTTALGRIETFVADNARALDVARFRHHLLGDSVDSVIAELARFQNEDGGFGHGLESDLRLPDSSPICTWVGLTQLVELGVDGESDLVQRALAYLTVTYQARTHGWPPVGAAVNDHPHGAWWDFDVEKGGTFFLDTPWNPTAALVGFMWHYGNPGPPSRTHQTDRAITYLRDRSDTDIEWHELNTLIQLASHAPEPQRQELQTLTAAAVDRVVERDPEEWSGYGPQPLNFVSGPEHYLYAGLREHVEANLDDWMETLQEDGAWVLSYKWQRDEEAFERLRPEITASFAIHRAIILRAFGRL
ncbi:MAG: hypothetical protein HN712_01210 [Gemmatimonadetes bacterium]|jgi:hypothetical protein|nr:hypothetical protein [Gemmatimonadota bacterium]MBT6149867.1 hypothetical protein [Gemmatimonadota bacterium]MBT7858890.1 hypothetical protein [Gemmatimonadota bacterium]